MSTVRSFDNYAIRLLGGNHGRVGLILCYKGAEFVGRIDFFSESHSMPQDYIWHPAGGSVAIILHMPISQFESVSSVIRNESSLHLIFNLKQGDGTSTHGRGHLATTENAPNDDEEAML